MTFTVGMHGKLIFITMPCNNYLDTVTQWHKPNIKMHCKLTCQEVSARFFFGLYW